MRFLLALAPLLLTATLVSAQAPRAPSAGGSDVAQIEAAVRHYFRAGDENSSAELRAAFHPTAMMFWVVPQGSLAGLSQADWQRRIDEAEAVRPALARRIDWVDVAGDAAAARLHSEYPTHTFEDYVSLLRVGGRWQIVGKIFHRGAQPPAVVPAAAEDRRAVESVLRAKLAAMDSSDAAGLDAIYHPRTMSYSVTPAADGRRLVAVSIAEWQARFTERRAAGKADPAKRTIDRLDLAGGAALARLTHDFGAERWVDYVSLLKVQGEWKIVGLLYLPVP